MKLLSLLTLLLIPVFVFAGCAPVSPVVQPKQSATAPTIATSISTLVITDTPSPTATLKPLDTLEPAQITETLQPLLQEPMNCAVPCFWGITPGKTSLDEVRIFFSKLGLTPFEKIYEGNGFYTILYNTGSGYDSSVTLHINNNLVESIEVTPDIPKPTEGSPREWIAYSPETLIRRYGSPSSVRFTVSSYGLTGSPPNIAINMIMYFDTPGLIVHYSGYNMTPESFCPSTAPFDHVRLWMGNNPPDTPSFETIPLEKATSLTMDQFTRLMKGDPKKACFTVKGEISP
jgi:hypothetical protein